MCGRSCAKEWKLHKLKKKKEADFEEYENSGTHRDTAHPTICAKENVETTFRI